MEIIQKCVNEVLKQLPTDLLLSEACYQRALAFFLAKFGSVEVERVLNINITDQNRIITVGSCRMDILWCPFNDNNKTPWILELKVSPKPYKINSFFPQISRYCHFYKKQFGKCEGVVVVFSPFHSECLHCVKSLP